MELLRVLHPEDLTSKINRIELPVSIPSLEFDPDPPQLGSPEEHIPSEHPGPSAGWRRRWTVWDKSSGTHVIIPRPNEEQVQLRKELLYADPEYQELKRRIDDPDTLKWMSRNAAESFADSRVWEIIDGPWEFFPEMLEARNIPPLQNPNTEAVQE